MEDDQSKVILDNILNFKNKDPGFVLNSIRQLAVIADALGPERTVGELLPYLHDLLDENAAIVSALLEAILGLTLDLNSKEAFNAVVYFFEEACAFQERPLRALAVTGLGAIFGRGSTSAFKVYVLNLLGRLKSSGSNERLLAAAQLVPRAAEVVRGADDLFKNVGGL